jgi:hypothetical protein
MMWAWVIGILMIWGSGFLMGLALSMFVPRVSGSHRSAWWDE